MITKGFKFKSGSLVAAKVDPDKLNQATIELFDPIEFVTFKYADYDTGQIIETISMAPFIPISKDESILVKMDDILVITNIHEPAERRYNDFIIQLERRAMHSLHESEAIFNDENNIPDDVLDLFDDMDMTKVQ